MARITYTYYKNFEEPELISEEKFKRLKEELSLNPKFKPYRNPRFRDLVKTSLLIYLVGIVLIIVFSFFQTKILDNISFVIVFLLILGLFTNVPTWLTAFKYVADRDNYYSILYKKIKKCDTYTDFISKDLKNQMMN